MTLKGASNFTRLRMLAIGGLLLVPLLAVGVTRAAAPTSGTVDGSATVKWQWSPIIGGTVLNEGIQDKCPPGPCDNYDLTVKLPTADADAFYASHTAELRLTQTWNSKTPDDIDIFAYSPGGKSYGPGTPDNASTGQGEEDLVIPNPSPGIWHIRAVGSQTLEPTTADGTATLVFGPPAPGFMPPVQYHVPGSPSFRTFYGPAELYTHNVGGQIGTSKDPTATTPKAESAEPSIGVDWKTGAVMYMTIYDTLKVTFDQTASGVKDTWTNVTSPITGTSTSDPILFTDLRTGRTFVSSLNFEGHCSYMAYTDDDGATWIPSKGCGTPAGLDHQTVGGGPFAQPITGGTPLYPDAVYYCSQELVTAFCAISYDGGTTFGAGVPVYNSETDGCGGLHGHVRVGPDGAAYLPNARCAGKQAVVVSENNGASWTLRPVEDSAAGQSDPSVAVGPDNTVYFGYQGANGQPMISISHDHGQRWSKSRNVGLPFKIANSEFSEVITGDAGRAAFAFLGTTTPGDDQASVFGCTPTQSDADASKVDCPGAIWHLYVAYTYDGGDTWTTTDATPDHLVQRGCIWNGGGANVCRNLLDFNDISLDAQGRVVIAYTQGCINACLNSTLAKDNTHSRIAAIARQQTGRGLLAAYDGKLGGSTASTQGPPGGGGYDVRGARVTSLPNTSGGLDVRLLLFLLPLPLLAGTLVLRRRLKSQVTSD